MKKSISLYLQAKQAYYFGASPIMSDEEFDALEDSIRQANPDEPALKSVGAPIPPSSLLTRATHRRPMGSQSKVNTAEEFARWERLRFGGQPTRYHASYKADGGSIALYYRNGHLEQAVTRGDGTEGEDITASAAMFQCVPIVLPEPLTVGVRCEAVLTNEDWKRADPSLQSNPRNLANGILGRLDGKKAHLVSALAFDIDFLDELPINLSTESGKAALLKRLGFSLTEYRGNLDAEGVRLFYEATRIRRASLPYWIDGIVVRAEDLATQRFLGSTDNRPKGQVAWKFPPQGARTTVLSIEWQVGFQGSLTPVAVIEPVRIGGTTVSRASLANADNIAALNVGIGSAVTVVKAGDIIPQIVSADSDDTVTTAQPPTECPECSHPLVRRTNVDGSHSAVLFCSNRDCGARSIGRIKRFAQSRDILGLGDSVIAALISNGTISSVPDLYTLTPSAIADIPINPAKGIKLGLSRASSICSEIATKATRMTLAEFLGAFGTRSLGVRRATLMIEAQPALSNIERWFDGSLMDPSFAAIAGVPQSAAIIFDSLKENEPTIRATLAHVTITSTQPQPANSTKGERVCITGSLPSGLKKKDYAPRLAAAGHSLVPDLTADCSALVVSNPDGPDSSKTKKARKLNIPLRDETWLASLCNTPAS